VGAYPSCSEQVRRAITTPTQDNEDAAWNAVLPAVDVLKELYEFSLELESAIPELLLTLSNDPSLQTQQALAKQLADVLDFVIRFDEAKMANPAIQNDFSYYRRTLNRMKLSKKDMNISIRDELANRMSLFFAYPTPMMKALIDKLNSSERVQAVASTLATMANACMRMVEMDTFETEPAILFCLRAMTGSVVLFDHIDDRGAFHKRSPILIRDCIELLADYPVADSLLNAIKYTTVHLNHYDTPLGVKQLLENPQKRKRKKRKKR